MEFNCNQSTVYLDQNVLDGIYKGQLRLPIDDLPELPIFVYSEETLKEIIRSNQGEQKFLDVLIAFDAHYLKFESDLSGSFTGRWEAVKSDVSRELASLRSTIGEVPEADENFGFNRVISKTYGGESNTSYGDVMKKGMEDCIEMLERTLLEAESELPPEIMKKYRVQADDLKRQLQEGSRDASQALDGASELPFVKTWENHTGLAPLNLKNIKAPRVIEKIWNELKSKNPEMSQFSIEHLSGIEPAYEGGVAKSFIIDKCLALYQTLNFLGYYRDKNMKKYDRTITSISDQMHVGYAAYCGYLISNDNDFNLKAKAIYEYLAIDTKVLKPISISNVS